jgi:hypothetical protein
LPVAKLAGLLAVPGDAGTEPVTSALVCPVDNFYLSQCLKMRQKQPVRKPLILFDIPVNVRKLLNYA